MHLCGRPAARPRHQAPARQRFEASQKSVAAQRTLRALMKPYALEQFLRETNLEEPGPIRDLPKLRRNRRRHEFVALPIRSRPRTRPAPLLRCSNEIGSHRVEFDIAHDVYEVFAIEWTGEEPILPQMPLPSIAPIDEPGVASVRARKRI